MGAAIQRPVFDRAGRGVRCPVHGNRGRFAGSHRPRLTFLSRPRYSRLLPLVTGKESTCRNSYCKRSLRVREVYGKGVRRWGLIPTYLHDINEGLLSAPGPRPNSSRDGHVELCRQCRLFSQNWFLECGPPAAHVTTDRSRWRRLRRLALITPALLVRHVSQGRALRRGLNPNRQGPQERAADGPQQG